MGEEVRVDDLLRALLIHGSAGRRFRITAPRAARGVVGCRRAPQGAGWIELRLLWAHDAPLEQRPEMLRPFLAVLWWWRGSSELAEFWGLIDVDVELEDPDKCATWMEPSHLWKARHAWAMRHDPHTMRAWCQLRFDVHLLRDDLDGLAEVGWPHLSQGKRRELALRASARQAAR